MNRCFSLFKMVVVFALLACSPGTVSALTNGLVLTPPMGYNTWYANGTSISNDYIHYIADTMVSSGMRDAGYQYLCVDDGWAGYRDTNGTIVADTNKFPFGMKAVVDYVHSKGLKFGIYTVMGPYTCAGLPGSFEHVAQDANTYASWGVDYLKYEGCSFPDIATHEQEQCELMGNALKNCGRPIVYTMSSGPFQSWYPTDLNMWRGTGDFTGAWVTALHHIDFVSQSPAGAGPGAWNDPDVLGTGFMAYPQDSAVFSMWCVLAAPLLTAIVGTNYTNVLCNAEAIAVDQDPAGIQGTCVASNGDVQVWCKPIGSSNGPVKAVALLNRDPSPGSVTVQWSDLGLPPGVATVRDLWSHEYVGNFTNSYTATIASESVQFIKVVSGATVPPRPVGTNYLSDLAWLPTTYNPYAIGQDQATGHGSISLRGVHYAKGLGAHAVSHIEYPLQGATHFHSDIGVDDDACCGPASVIFRVSVDGTKIYDSGVMTLNSSTQTIDVDVTGKSVLTLDVTNGISGNVADHADWAGARITMPPAPTFSSFNVVGTNLIVGGSGGFGSTPYYLLTSTNPALPANQWSHVATNFFDASGHFNFTNIISRTNRFFRLLVP